MATTPTKRPARRLPRDLDEDGEVAPRPKAPARAQPVEDDDDDEPVSPGTQIRGGWTEGQKQMDSTSSFAQTLKLEEKTQVVKFLDDTPYANFRRHWIERSAKEGKTLRAYTCLQTFNRDCPLCEVGDRPQAVAAFNIAVVGDDGQVMLKSWDCGPRLFNVLKGYANDPKIAPLTKGFFIASKTGKRGTVQHNVSPVSRSALEEDFDVEPPAQADLDGLTRYTPDVVEVPKLSTLKELAEELADEYE